MAGALITDRELALWSQQSESAVEADDWAQEVIAKFSDYARYLSGQDWSLYPATEAETVPPVDVRLAVLRAARTTYVNPNSERQSSVGPIASTILDEAAVAGAFTESEVAKIQSYHPDGDPSGIWVMSLRGGVLPFDEEGLPLYIADDQQVNISSLDSAWPTWDIPMFTPGGPGDDGGAV